MRSGWTRFAGFGVAFEYPEHAERVDRDDLVHVHSADRSELYFEVARFRALTPHEEYARHKPYLEERFGSGAVTELAETTLGDETAWTYSFGWSEDGRELQRTALLLAVGGDTCRIIRGPRSALNDEVLATFTLD